MSKGGIWVTFKSAIPAEVPEMPHPPGLAVAKAIGEGLRTAELPVDETENWRDSGYSINVTVGDRRVYVLLSAVGQPYADWALCCTSDHGWFGRMVGKDDTEQRRELAVQVDRVLQGDTRFSAIRWYGSSGWRGLENPEWRTHPE